MPRKSVRKKPVTKAESEPVAITRVSAKSLLDERLRPVKGLPDSRVTKIIAIAAILGFAAGFGILIYLYFSRSPVEPVVSHQIILPDQAQPAPAAGIKQATSTPSVVSPPAPTSTPAALSHVVILSTPTGYLNVRSGPGANYAKTGQVTPGATYELLSVDQGNGIWYQIKLDAAHSGWVTKQYAAIK